MTASVGIESVDRLEAATSEIGWLGLLALLGNSVMGAVGLLAAGLVLPLLAKDFAAVPNVALLAQLVSGIVGAACAVGSPLAGRAIDRYGVRSVYVAGALLFAGAGAVPVILGNLYLILVARAFLGLAVAAVIVAGSTGLGRLPPKRRARLLGYSALIGGVTAMLVFPLIGQLAKYGWRIAFLPHLVALVFVPLALTLPREKLSRAGRESSVSRTPLRLPIALLPVAGFGGMVAFIGPVFSAFYLASINVSDPGAIAIPLTIGAGCSLLGSAGFGLVYSRLGGSGVFAVAFLLVAAGLMIDGTAQSIIPFALGAALGGAGAAFLAPNYIATAVAAAGPTGAARAVGLVQAAMFSTQAVFPFISEPVRRAAGPGMVFIGFGITSLLIGLGYAMAGLRNRERN
jgi:predicted MFS family arabinose efflux permease